MASGQISVFYPHRLDFWGPINTMNREVASNLPPQDFRTVSTYADPSFPAADHVDTAVRLNRIPWPYHARKAGNALQIAALFAKRYDIVHTGYWDWDVAALLSQKRGADIVHTFHGPTKATIERQERLAKAADVVTAVSPVVKESVSEFLDLDTAIHVVPDGVNLERFHPDVAPTESGLVISIGRLIEDKHPELIVDLARQCPDVEFVLVGPGPALDPPELPNLTHYPELSRDEVAALCSRATLAAHPFENEGFSLVTLEAMASGTPVVAFDDANLSRIVTPQNGRLCTSLDVDEWEDAIRSMIGRTDKYDPRDTVTQYAWPTVANQYAKVYQTAVNRT